MWKTVRCAWVWGRRPYGAKLGGTCSKQQKRMGLGGRATCLKLHIGRLLLVVHQFFIGSLNQIIGHLLAFFKLINPTLQKLFLCFPLVGIFEIYESSGVTKIAITSKMSLADEDAKIIVMNFLKLIDTQRGNEHKKTSFPCIRWETIQRTIKEICSCKAL